jgi:catechol 2,3-dioxygenase-like lactoylglutathione lyase family enzyme
MFLGIDHLVIAVSDPDAAADALTATLGLTAGSGGRHDRLGTFNRLVWLGDSYLELIGVFDADLARASWVGRPTTDALHAGGGLATWAIATDAIDADVARLRETGSDLAQPIAGERVRPDRGVVRWRLSASPSLAPDAPPFLIEHDPTSAEWTAADRAARGVGAVRLSALEIAVHDVAGTTRRYLATLGLRFRPSLRGGGARDADIGRQIVRIRPRPRTAEPPTVVRLTLPGREALQFDLLGCRWIVGP